MIDKAIEAITNDKDSLPVENEWEMLLALEPLMADATHKDIFFFDNNLERVNLS